MNSQEIAELTTKAIEDSGQKHFEPAAAKHSPGIFAAIGRFHKYSLHNVLLIALQKPDATRVAGFHTWHRLGRHVRKGEKGITHPRAHSGDGRRILEIAIGERVEKTVIGYHCCTVFDASQTEGKELPSIGKVRGDAHYYGERLVAFTLSLGIRLEYSAAIAPARGISEGGKITLLPELASAEHAAVLARELGARISPSSAPAARRPQKPCARLKPRRWPMWSASPLDSKTERPLPITSSCIEAIRSCSWKVSTTSAWLRVGFSMEFWKIRAEPEVPLA